MMMQLMHRDLLEQKDGLLEQEIQPPQNPPCPAARCPPALLPAPLPCPVSLAPLPLPPAPLSGGGGGGGGPAPTPASHHTLI